MPVKDGEERKEERWPKPPPTEETEKGDRGWIQELGENLCRRRSLEGRLGRNGPALEPLCSVTGLASICLLQWFPRCQPAGRQLITLLSTHPLKGSWVARSGPSAFPYVLAHDERCVVIVSLFFVNGINCAYK